MTEQRFTLSLPPEIYNEIKVQAEKRNASIKEVVRQVLKLGLVALEIDEDPNTELLVRERIAQQDDIYEIRDTRLKFIF